jgi:hypothetical protein
MTKDEALRLALKAMVVNNKAWKHLADSGDAGYWEAEEQGYYQLNEQAITAVKAALEAKDEPWEKFCDSNCVWTDHHPDCKLAQPEHGWTPERIAGMARLKEAQDKKLAQPEQEPVAWRAWVSKFPQGTGSDWVYVTKPIMKDSIHNQPLYTTPPQRTWEVLKDKEIEEIWNIAMFTDYGIGAELSNQPFVHYARAIEAKLKEKNT